jgi:hypothetical protein
MAMVSTPRSDALDVAGHYRIDTKPAVQDAQLSETSDEVITHRTLFLTVP